MRRGLRPELARGTAECGERRGPGKVAHLQDVQPREQVLFVLPAAAFSSRWESLVEELTSRGPWKMHGQDVSNSLTVALWKGVITLNNAHRFM